jgi:hypothetical protein
MCRLYDAWKRLDDDDGLRAHRANKRILEV